jgi:outer membrane biogenesis lipoprotein LolB
MTRMNRRFAIAATLLATAMLSGCSQAAPATQVKPPQSPADYAAERDSAQGAFRVAYRTDGAAVPVHQLHSWTLHIARPDGTPVNDALIEVDGDMPEHRHGLPTRPRVTRNLGNGDYLVEGVKFQMGGWWVMDFRIAAGGRTDTVRFHLQLKK